MNPQDIYLQHCQMFAHSNFYQNLITVEDYRINQQDIRDKIFKPEDTGCESSTILDTLSKQERKKILIDDYNTIDIKIYPEMLMVED